MNKSFKFIVAGKPICMYRDDTSVARVWDDYSQRRCNFRIDLLSQLNSFETTDKYVDIIINFYLPMNMKDKVHKFTIIDMCRFVNNVASGILYKRDALIQSMTSDKYYDDDPRTEITIKLRSSNEDHQDY